MKIICDNCRTKYSIADDKVKGKVFRIGHLGWFNDLMLAGTLAGVEMGLKIAGVPYEPGGTQVALDWLAGAEA